MALITKGRLIKETVVWQGTTVSNLPKTFPLLNKWSSYAQLYQSQLWVYVLVGKLARAHARLPLKVYRRTAGGRVEVRDSPFAQLWQRPNERQSTYEFWEWVASTLNIFGEAFVGKVRDRGGRVTQLVPMHPTAMEWDRDAWQFDNGTLRLDDIPAADVVQWRNYHPDNDRRGLSPLEPLRATLQNEDATRRAVDAFWLNGGRPSVVLTHPAKMTGPAMERLRASWEQVHGGVDNFAKVAILEEGLKPEIVQLNAEELQYIETRKLNREEVCAAYDIPPPVVHILDHATYANITEQMRSMYRDTMTPRIEAFEAVIEAQVRAADFPDDEYAEFLLDEVLRGDFENRVDAYQKGINSGWLMPSEVRALENLPPVEGSDRLFVNSTMVPLEEAAGQPAAEGDVTEQLAVAGDLGTAVQRLGLGVSYGVLTADEARQFLPLEGRAAPAPPEGRQLSQIEVRTVMGRLSRQETLGQVDGDALVQGLNGATPVVLGCLEASKGAGETIAQLRERIKALEEIPHS